MDFQNRTFGRMPREYAVFQHYYVKGYNRYKPARDNYLFEPQYSLGLNDKDAIDDLLSQKNDILKAKLDVLTNTLHERLEIREKNITSLDYDECKIDTILHDFYLSVGRCRYAYDVAKRRSSLDSLYFEIKGNRRKENIECWRDIAMLTKDLLAVWEEYQQGKARARLLEND